MKIAAWLSLVTTATLCTGHGGRSKRYSLEGGRWREDVVTYNISRYSRQIRKDVVEDYIGAAFKIWSDVINLVFVKENRGDVHINIRFETGHHSVDANDPSFDGPGGYHAHAFFPVYGGEVHFDDDEDWILENEIHNHVQELGRSSSSSLDLQDTLPSIFHSQSQDDLSPLVFQDSSYLFSSSTSSSPSKDHGARFLLVATHEIGHALGLGHSDKNSAIMAPTHKDQWEIDVRLDSDDIAAIQALYGRPGGYSFKFKRACTNISTCCLVQLT